MDTKWKSISRNRVTKAVAFAVAVIMVSASVLFLEVIKHKGFNYEDLFINNYMKSSSYYSDMIRDVYGLSEVIYSPYTVPFEYYLSDGMEVYTNTAHTDQSYYEDAGRTFFYLKNGEWISGDITVPSNNYRINEKYIGYIAFTQEYYDLKQQQWTRDRNGLIRYISIEAILVLISGLFLVFLVRTNGKKTGDDTVYEGRLDRYLPEGILFFPLFLLIITILWDLDGRVLIRNFFDVPLSSPGAFILVLLMGNSIALTFLLSVIRRYKTGTLVKQSIIYIFCVKAKHAGSCIFHYLFKPSYFKALSLTQKLYHRQLILSVSMIVFILATLLLIIFESMSFLIPLFCIIAISYWYWRGNKKLYGDVEQDIRISLNDKIASERTKIALITNVSHDLKTPLTSIISYIDLLSREEGLSETASDYIRILQAKSGRLKNIVTDLFELARSSSGDVKPEYEVLDLKRLIEQTLVELEDRITASGLQIKTKLPEVPVNIKSDGKRLYRVFQNVLDNALKYSLQGSRIYIDLDITEDKAIATVKNTANYEMNFTAAEILQRFVRADEARTEEGSGLGLSIAESFTKVCGGDFQVIIDGDLFKVIIGFPDSNAAL